MRARLWRGETLVADELGSLSENLYFAQEVLLLLEATGFEAPRVEAGYTGREAGPDDATLVFVARRPAAPAEIASS
jgi:hypothetical protein